MASQDWFDKDFYKTLGVSKDVNDQELKKAYRKMARQYHPDSNPDNPAAEKRFKEISEAYSVLSDSTHRSEYDQMRAMGSGARFTAPPTSGQGGFEDIFGGFSSEPNMNSVFSSLFGQDGFHAAPRQTKGRDMHSAITISFQTAIQGGTITLKIPSSTSALKVNIPPGVNNGQKIKLRGKGYPSEYGGEPGDLLLQITVAPHPVFEREGIHLRMRVPITFVEAALGATLEVPTFGGGTVKLKVPAGTPSGQTLRVKKRGIKKGKETGDLFVTVEVAVPVNLSSDSRKKLEKFAESLPPEDLREDLMHQAQE